MKRFTRQHFLLIALLCVLTTAPVMGQAAPRFTDEAPPNAKPSQGQVNWNYAFYAVSAIPGYSFVLSAWNGIVLLPGCSFQSCGTGWGYPTSYNRSKAWSQPYYRIP